MARKTPMPDRELAICRRLRQYREASCLSRVRFARRAGIDSSILSSYEHCRAPLRWGVARRIWASFEINPAWLATGEGDQWGLHASPALVGHLADESQLFSKVYDECLVDYLKKEPLERLREWFAHGADRSYARLYARSLIFTYAIGWFTDCPEDRLFDLFESLIRLGNNFLEWYPSGGNGPRALITPSPDSAGKSQTGLDRLNESFSITAVTKVLPPTFEDLLKRLKIATKPHGAKTALAKEMGVSPQRLNGWLNGWTTPDGSVTLRLLQFVLQVECQKQGDLGGVGSTAKVQTQTKKLNEKPSSGPPKE